MTRYSSMTPIVKRIQDRGWSIDRALSVPVGGAEARSRRVEKKIQMLEEAGI